MSGSKTQRTSNRSSGQHRRGHRRVTRQAYGDQRDDLVLPGDDHGAVDLPHGCDPARPARISGSGRRSAIPMGSLGRGSSVWRGRRLRLVVSPTSRGDEVRWRRIRGPCHRPAGRRREKRHEGSGSRPAARRSGTRGRGSRRRRRRAAARRPAPPRRAQDRDGRATRSITRPSVGTSRSDPGRPATRCRTGRRRGSPTSRSSPDPVFVKPCASPGGLTTTCPSSMTSGPVADPERRLAGLDDEDLGVRMPVELRADARAASGRG